MNGATLAATDRDSIAAERRLASSQLATAAHLRELCRLLEAVDRTEVDSVVALLRGAREGGRTLFTFGNGGSAATAMHLANDLILCGPAHRVICLNANISALTALANDRGYESVFSDQLDSLIGAGDVVVGFSASGNSANCVRAMRLAEERSAITVGFVGFDGGSLHRMSKHSIHANVNDYRLVEDVHMAICHAMIAALRCG